MTNFFNRGRMILSMGVVAALTLVGSASASTIAGSLSFAYFGTITQTGTNLADATDNLTTPSVITSNVGSGDYSTIASGLSYGATGLDLNNIATGGGFSISNGVTGSSFVASFGVVVAQGCTSINPFSCSLDVYLVGIANITGFDPTISSFRTSFTQSDTALSGSGTLTSPALPPPGVPEPATLSLLGSALVGLGLLRKKFAR